MGITVKINYLEYDIKYKGREAFRKCTYFPPFLDVDFTHIDFKGLTESRSC